MGMKRDYVYAPVDVAHLASALLGSALAGLADALVILAQCPLSISRPSPARVVTLWPMALLGSCTA